MAVALMSSSLEYNIKYELEQSTTGGSSSRASGNDVDLGHGMRGDSQCDTIRNLANPRTRNRIGINSRLRSLYAIPRSPEVPRSG